MLRVLILIVLVLIVYAGPKIFKREDSRIFKQQYITRTKGFYERYGDQVPVVGIDYLDVQPEAALELVRRSGVTYPLLADPGGDLDRRDGFPPVLGLPYLVFVGADGKVYTQAGGVGSVDELVDLVDKHLGVAL